MLYSSALRAHSSTRRTTTTLSRTSKSMSSPLSSALENHLQQFGSSSDVDCDSASDASERERGLGRNQSQRQRRSVGNLTSEEPSFWGLVFAETSPGRGASTVKTMAKWWRQQHPIIVRFIHEYGALLVNYLAPLTPRAARLTGYRRASHDLLRSLDRLEAGLPGRKRDCASRCRSRSREQRRERALCGEAFSIYRAVSGVGVMAVAVVFAAVSSYCSWRRSSPSWPILIVEVAFGSAGAAYYLAREDGHEEAKQLEANLTALERSLVPFFRGVQACMRMVRCAQTLSFGLRLSVPMPPVARMEGRLSTTLGGSGPVVEEVALRELRSVIVDVLHGGTELVSGFQSGTTAVDSNTRGLSENEGLASDAAGNCQAAQLLGGLARMEKQLSADLRRFLADVASRIDESMKEADVCGLWWDSHVTDMSEAVRELATYFEAGAERLEMAIGSGGQPCVTSGDTSASRDIASAAEALSELRLHYEEAVVRLYSCQSSASTMLRDPTTSKADAWKVIHQELADAKMSTESVNCNSEVWRKAEELVGSLAKEDGEDGADLGVDASTGPEPPSDASRHLEAGVGWVSLATPREEDPRVFEGGSGDEGLGDKPRTPPDTGVTNVLIGASPSPGRSRCVEEEGGASRATAAEVVDERSRALLVGELDSVLRARPLPRTFEKHLPFDDRHPLEEGEGSETSGPRPLPRTSEKYLPFEDRQPLEHGEGEGSETTSDEQNAEPYLHLPAPSMTPTSPIAENTLSQDLVSELRAQLSMAANEEIFSSHRHQPAVSSDGDEDSLLVGYENKQHDRAASSASHETG